MIRSAFVISLMVMLMISCVKPYDFDPASFEKVLVVDGQLTNETGGHYVVLKYTYPLDTLLNEYVDDAQVYVESSDNESHLFTNVGEGVYVSESDFAGEIGKEYQLHVRTADDESFTSKSELLIAPPSIEKIYGEYAVLPNDEGTASVGGIQFFINTNDDSPDDATHFRFSYVETYKIIVPYPANYELVRDTVVIPLERTPGICYSENESSELLFGTTVGNSENRLTEFPIVFVSEDKQELRVRYSLLVKQYTISDAAYSYYRELRENEQGGSLFDKQTGSIFGNILSDKGEPVLGYFEVAGVSTKRVFYDPEDFDERLELGDFLYPCSYQSIITSSIDSAAYYLNTYDSRIFSWFSEEPEQVYIHSKPCTDCSWYADVTPPDYWIE